MNLPFRSKSKSSSKATSAVKSEEKKITNPWLKISKASIYLLVFLLPLFFLPFTANILDFNKQALLIVLTFISLFGWLLGVLTEGKISFNLNPFHIPVIAFLAVLAVSTCFSAYKYGSFWGWPLNIGSSFLTYLGFVLLYFLIVNLFQKKEEIFWLLFTLVFSSSLVSIFGGLQIFGKFYLPFDFAKDSSFNTIGTVRALGIFTGALLPLIIFLAYITKRLIKLLLLLFGVAAFALLFVVNFWVVWLSILIGTAAILIFGIAKRGTFKPLWLNLVMALFVISLFFTFLRTSIPFLPQIPIEVSLSSKTGFDIAKKTLKEFNSPISWFLGSGPGTFTYSYSRFKPETINQTNFWDARFGSSGSGILDKLATTGVLGFCSFLGILAMFGYLGTKQLIKNGLVSSGKEKTAKPDFQWILASGIFASWLSLTATIFLYPDNLTFLFLFWILMASFVALQEGKVKTFVLEPSSLSAILVSFVFVLTLVLSIGAFFFGGQRYAAEIKYFQGLNALQKGQAESATNYLLDSINLTNNSQDNYWRDLAQIYLFRINQELQRPGATQQELSQIITPLMSSSVNASKMATDVAPKNVANWTIRGFVYYQMRNTIPGANEWALQCYEEGLKLEPSNPLIWTELGRVYLAQNKISEAREDFQKAIELKPDYAPAHFQAALASQLEGKTAEAIEKMEITKQIASPFDVGVAFQLGILYYNDKQFGKAKIELERAVSLNPTYSNALYFLGLIYDREGKKDKAIEQFEIISGSNPDNQEIKQILSNLKSGKPALQGVVPGQPPIEEKPPEQIKK